MAQYFSSLADPTNVGSSDSSMEKGHSPENNSNFSGKYQVLGSHQACMDHPKAPAKLNAYHDPPSHDIYPYDQECNQRCEDG